MKKFILLSFLSLYTQKIFANPLANNTNFNCQQKTDQNQCSYFICIGHLNNYPKETAIIFTEALKEVQKIKIHLHGHVGMVPSYDKNLQTLIDGFKMAPSICQSPNNILVIPWSSGKNADYASAWPEAKSFSYFLNELVLTIGSNLEKIRLHFSAHSGGGKYVARFAGSGENWTHKIDQIDLFDAIYSSQTFPALESWINLNHKKTLNLINLAPSQTSSSNFSIKTGASPYNYSIEFWKKKSCPLKSEHNPIECQVQETKVNFAFSTIDEANHWSLVKNWWQK